MKAGMLMAMAAIALCVVVCPVESREKDDARIVAAVSTWTQLSFVTFTTTQFTTCQLAVSTVACRKRKLRRFHPRTGGPEISNQDIFSSLDSSTGAEDKAGSQDTDKEGKLAVTIWSSVTSTFTMTMTSIDTATTYSLSFACSVNGANIPPACG